jgi:K+-sensing histidine kinase KdpD
MPAWLRSVAIVVASVAVATLLTFSLQHVAIHTLALFLLAAVIVSARFGGPYAGIATALISVLVFDWFFDRSPGRLDFTAGGAIRAAVFCSVAILVASLEVQRRRAMEALASKNQELMAALEEIRTLRGILPICMHCKQIRDERGAWVRLEKYVQEHSHAEFTHGVCPTCLKKHYPEYLESRTDP